MRDDECDLEIPEIKKEFRSNPYGTKHLNRWGYTH